MPPSVEATSPASASVTRVHRSLVELPPEAIGQREAVGQLPSSARQAGAVHDDAGDGESAGQCNEHAGAVAAGDVHVVCQGAASLSNWTSTATIAAGRRDRGTERLLDLTRQGVWLVDARPSGRGTCQRPRRRARWRRWLPRCRARRREQRRRDGRADRPSSRQATSTIQWSGVPFGTDRDPDGPRRRQRLDQPSLAGELVGFVRQHVAVEARRGAGGRRVVGETAPRPPVAERLPTRWRLDPSVRDGRGSGRADPGR